VSTIPFLPFRNGDWNTDGNLVLQLDNEVCAPQLPSLAHFNSFFQVELFWVGFIVFRARTV